MTNDQKLNFLLEYGFFTNDNIDKTTKFLKTIEEKNWKTNNINIKQINLDYSTSIRLRNKPSLIVRHFGLTSSIDDDVQDFVNRFNKVFHLYDQLHSLIDFNSDDFYQGFFKYQQTKPKIETFYLENKELLARFRVGKNDSVQINIEYIIARNNLDQYVKNQALKIINKIKAIT